MKKLAKLTIAFLVSIGLATPIVAQANYPDRPVKLIVPFGPGGFTDVVARILGQKLSVAMGQQFVVENKPGAGNLIGIESVARAPADGYTLLFVPSPLVLNPILYKKVNYDPVKDFAPISLAATAPNIFVVHPSVKASNIKEWIALAKKDANALSYASAGVGTSPHMSMELFNYMAGVQSLHVPYKGSTLAHPDLLDEPGERCVGGQRQRVGDAHRAAVAGGVLDTPRLGWATRAAAVA